MEEDFHITGLFYMCKGHKCRSYLDIKRKGSKASTPDIMVVMMNPGSSRPKDGVDDNTKDSAVESEILPGPTQYQIMRVMNGAGLDYARVLNLSDLKNPDSSDFRRLLGEIDKQKLFSHSIFDPARKSEFDTLFVSDVPVILAWGVHNSLRDLSNAAVAAVVGSKIAGVRKQGNAYYHPMPRIKGDQDEWVKKVVAQLTP